MVIEEGSIPRPLLIWIEIQTATSKSTHTPASVARAVLHRRPAFGDITMPLQAGGPDWGLRDNEKAKVRQGLRSILSVPVFDPAHINGPLLATLQVDSDATLDELGFDEQETWEMAQRFADVISLLLDTAR